MIKETWIFLSRTPLPHNSPSPSKTSPRTRQSPGTEEVEEEEEEYDGGCGRAAAPSLFFHHGMNGMAGYLKTPSGHSHFPTHPTLGTSLTGMPMPALGPFGLPHSLDPVPFPQGKYISLTIFRKSKWFFVHCHFEKPNSVTFYFLLRIQSLETQFKLW